MSGISPGSKFFNENYNLWFAAYRHHLYLDLFKWPYNTPVESELFKELENEERKKKYICIRRLDRKKRQTEY